MVHNIYEDDLVNEKPFSEIFSEFLQWISSIVTTTEKHTGIIHTPGINYCFYFILHLLPHNICFYVVLVAHNGFNFDFPCLLSEISRVRGDTSILEDHQIHFSDSLHHFRQVVRFMKKNEKNA